MTNRFFTKITLDGVSVEVVTARRAYFVVDGEWETSMTFSNRDMYDNYIEHLNLENYLETLTPPPFSTEKTSLFVRELREDALARIENHLGYTRNKFLRRWLTEYEYRRWKSEEITDQCAMNYARKRLERDTFKTLTAEENHLRNALAGTEPRIIAVLMEYTRAGAVHCTINLDNKKAYKGHAYGYGYDKRSAALADALNKSYDALSILAHAKDKALENGESDWSASATSGRCNHNILGYGSGYQVIPCFEGGVGMSSLIDLFNRRGYHATGVFGDNADAFTLVKKEV